MLFAGEIGLVDDETLEELAGPLTEFKTRLSEELGEL
jgi:hypothetical protein